MPSNVAGFIFALGFPLNFDGPVGPVSGLGVEVCGLSVSFPFKGSGLPISYKLNSGGLLKVGSGLPFRISGRTLFVLLAERSGPAFR